MNLSKQQESFTIQRETKMSRDDKIYHFDMLSWASAGATLVSIWQIIIPFSIFSLNKPQLLLGFTSIFFLIVSLLVLYWSHRGFTYLKKEIYEDNVPHDTWHVEGTIYVISFILIALYISCFLGILSTEGYSWALMTAQGVPTETAKKEAFIIILSQLILIVIDVILLIYYVKVSYNLEMQPMHLPSVLGWFIAIFIFMCCMTIGNSHYLPSKLGAQVDHIRMENSESAHSSIFWTCLIGLLFALFTLFEQRSIQQESIPKIKFYFLPFLLIMIASVFLITNSLNFLFESSKTIKESNYDCKSTVQSFQQSYIDSIGCPSKYKTINIQGSVYYDLYCSQDEVGIVWENEENINNSEKRNQLACMNLSCCHLINQERSLSYKQYFLQSILTALLGFIAAGHCFDIAIQDPNVIKGGPSVYSQTKFIIQIILSLFSIIIGVYLSIKYNEKILTMMPQFDSKQHINSNPKQFLSLSSLESLEQCQLVKDSHNNSFTVHFDHNACAGQAKCDRMGFHFCLHSTNAILQILPTWQNKEIAIFGNKGYDPYQIQQALKNQINSDYLCAEGLENPINDLLKNHVYACKNPDKQAILKFEAKAKEIIFEQQIENIESKNTKFDLVKTIILTNKNIKTNELEKQTQSENEEEPEELGNYASIQLIVTDGETFTPLQGAKVNVFINVDKCQQLNQNINYPIRTLETNSSGMLTIWNVQMESKQQQFTFQVKKDNYYFNCLITKHLKPFYVNTFYVPLTKLLTQNSEMKVMLWYQNPKLNLELGANVLFEKNLQCNVGFYFENCNYMKYTSNPKSQKQISRVIQIDQITNFNYIFFVKHIPINSDIIEVVNNKGLSLIAKLQSELELEIDEFQKSQPKLSIYSKNSEYPIIYTLPSNKKEEIDTTPELLFWLGFCMNGKEGLRSIQSIDHIWEKKDGSQYWQRHTVQPNTIPDSQICEKLKI